MSDDSDWIDKVFQQYRQSAVFYSATVITVTLALAAALIAREKPPTLLAAWPTLRVATVVCVFLILLGASAIQYLVFRGSYIHANRTLKEDKDERAALWRKGNEMLSTADKLTGGVFFLFVFFLTLAAWLLARP